MLSAVVLFPKIGLLADIAQLLKVIGQQYSQLGMNTRALGVRHPHSLSPTVLR